MEDFRIKYRPKTLGEIWGQDHVKMIWSGYLRKGYFPRSIILSSNFGMGKTTLAHIFAEDIIKFDSSLYCKDFVEYNSPTCDFTCVHKHIGKRNTCLMNPRVIFFDEAQRMPEKAQDGFLTAIEKEASLTIIFATTEFDKIDEGLRQRSDKYRLMPPPKETLVKELRRISAIENIRIEQDALDYVVDISGYSPRACLGNLQILSHNNGVIDMAMAKTLLVK
ncbi:MAG: AAA family ATPase [Candidatus Omnitrophica bacterium]|nr:AAA family ATPase [Candidatus Omnitrophota bacterium]